MERMCPSCTSNRPPVRRIPGGDWKGVDPVLLDRRRSTLSCRSGRADRRHTLPRREPAAGIAHSNRDGPRRSCGWHTHPGRSHTDADAARIRVREEGSIQRCRSTRPASRPLPSGTRHHRGVRARRDIDQQPGSPRLLQGACLRARQPPLPVRATEDSRSQCERCQHESNASGNPPAVRRGFRCCLWILTRRTVRISRADAGIGVAPFLAPPTPAPLPKAPALGPEPARSPLLHAPTRSPASPGARSRCL